MTGKERDRILFARFMDGLCMGCAYAVMAVAFVIILFFLMFVSPEEKTVMVGEPCAIVMNLVHGF